jgi:sterol desaturase/sphingolipid hydroxylase (fatty acid hydroxylase superfamily)
MKDALSFLVTHTLRMYAILLSIYLVSGFIITRMNSRTPKIQARQGPVKSPWGDIRQSMLSLLSISAFFAGGTYLQTIGIGFQAPKGYPGMTASLIASMLVFDACFYWGHRLAHTKLFYRPIHKFHHIAVTPTVWSNNSEKIADNLFMQSYFLFAHLLVPISPAVLLVHKIYDQITGMLGHSGHEYSGGPTVVYPSPMVAVTFHDQHHEFFNCNYSTHFSIWDRLMGTIHPTYDRLAASKGIRSQG